MEVDSPQRPSPMTTNTTAENVIEISSSPVMPALKRKGEERRHDGKENGGDKRVKLDCEYSLVGTRHKARSDDVAIPNSQGKPLVELKGKKLVYKEDAAPWSIPKRRESHTWPNVIGLTDRPATFLHLAA
jgi:hypothetical protein